MSETFKAIVINQTEKEFTREVKSIDKSFLKNGDVLVMNIEKGEGETMERSMDRIEADPEMSEESEKMLLN